MSTITEAAHILAEAVEHCGDVESFSLHTIDSDVKFSANIYVTSTDALDRFIEEFDIDEHACHEHQYDDGRHFRQAWTRRNDDVSIHVLFWASDPA